MGHIFSMRLASMYRHALCIDFRHTRALRRAAGTRRRVPSTTLAAWRQHLPGRASVGSRRRSLPTCVTKLGPLEPSFGGLAHGRRGDPGGASARIIIYASLTPLQLPANTQHVKLMAFYIW